MRPTPETDDQPIINAINDNGYQVPCVDIEFARKLERERDEALMDRARGETATMTLAQGRWMGGNKMSERPTPETDAYWQNDEYEALRDDHKISRWSDFARRLERQRDEAMEELEILRSNKMSDPLLETTFKHLIRERDEAIARSKEWSDWCVEYKSELEEAQKDTKILSRRMKTLWDSSEKVCRERDELLKECMQMSIEFGLPPTIRPADGEIRKMINGWKQAIVERDEAREAFRLAEDERMDVANQLESEKLCHARCQNERDEARENAEYWQELYRTVSTY